MRKLINVIYVQYVKLAILSLILLVINPNSKGSTIFNLQDTPKISNHEAEELISSKNKPFRNRDNVRDRIDIKPLNKYENKKTSINSEDIWWDNSISPSYSGIAGSVKTSVEYNGELIVGGNFTVAENGYVNNIAAWNGSLWRPLESKSRDVIYQSVSALVVYKNKLVVAGSVGMVDGKNRYIVSTWDGTKLTPMQSKTKTVWFNDISALTVYNNKLILAGSIEIQDTTKEYIVSQWDDSTWSTIGAVNGGGRHVILLAVFKDLLIVGGEFRHINASRSENIAAWDGSSWLSLERGVKGVYSEISSLTVLNDKLLVTGKFSTAGAVYVDNAATWDGINWSAPAGWGSNSQYNVSYMPLVIWKDCVVLSRARKGYDISSFDYLLWDGNSLSSPKFNKGIGGLLAPFDGNFCVYNSQLIRIGGYNNSMSYWSGSSWLPLGKIGTKGQIDNTVVFDDLLIAGGKFSSIGGKSINNLASWDGDNWSAVGNEIDLGEAVTALAVYKDQLIVATISHGIEMGQSLEFPKLYSWDGSTWSDIGGFIYSQVNAMIVYDDKLILAGGKNLFADTNPYRASSIVAWNGNTWEPFDVLTKHDGTIYALEVYDNKLIAAGHFHSFDDVTGDYISRNIAAWDGSSWLKFGVGMWNRHEKTTVYALSVYDNKLIVAGAFDFVESKPVNNIVTWDGSSWSSLDSGIGVVSSYDSQISTLKVFDNKLFAGGSFGLAGSSTVHNIASWDGDRWFSLGSGTGPSILESYSTVSSLSIFHDRLVVSGIFTSAGRKISVSLAEWTKIERRPFLARSPKLGLPDDFNLKQNYPNPFNPSTVIEYALSQKSQVRLTVYNSLGQKVATLVNQQQVAGTHQVIWDGTNSSGKKVSSGLYFYKLKTDDAAFVKKMLLLK